MSVKQVFNFLAVMILAASLFACGSTEDRKEKFMLQGKQLFQAGNYKQAQHAFENALQINPEDYESRYQIAESLSKQGEMLHAFEAYQDVLKKDEKHLMSRIRLGQLLLLNGQQADAENMLQQVLAIDPENAEVLVFQAYVNVLKNNTDAAIVSTEKALQLNPDSTSALMMMASIYHKTAKTDQAINLLQQAVGRLKGHDGMHLMLANLYLKNKDKSLAEEQFNIVLKLKPADFSAYQRLAAFYLLDNQLDQSEQVLREGLRHSSGRLQAQLYLIDFIAEKRNLDVAMAELLPMIEQNAQDYALQFKLAALQLNKGQPVQAEDTLKEIIKQDKLGESGIKARNTLAALYLSLNRMPQAKTMVAEVLTVQRDNHDALLLQGRFALAEGMTEQAINDFRKLLASKADDVQAMKLLASAHVLNNDTVLAAENMQKVVALNAQDKTARQDLIELLIRLSQDQLAEQHLAVLLKQDAANKKALESLFKLRVKQKNWSAAQQVTQLFLQDKANESLGHYMSGLAYQAEGQLQASIDSFKNVLKIKPDAIEPLTQLIKSYIALDQFRHAQSFLKKLIKNDKDHFIAYKLLGDLYLQQKKWHEADKTFRQTIKIKPEWADIYRHIAQIALIEKDQAAAIKILRKGIDKTDATIVLVNELAAIYHNKGDHTEALALYETAYKKQPASVLAINNLASYLSNVDQSQESLARAAKLAEPLEQTSNSHLLDTVAWIAFKQGRYDKAQGILEKVIASSGAGPVIYYHLGMVYYKQGNNEQARFYLDRAVSAATDFDGIEQGEQVLQSIKSS